MQVYVVKTGSTGNCTILENNIAIDMGVSFKTIKQWYKQMSIVLLTHEHSDHLNKTTIRTLANARPTLRFACCEWLVPKLLAHEGMGGCQIPQQQIDVLKIGKIYDYKRFKIEPIELVHDVPNCGYKIYIGDKKAIYATDTANLNGIEAKDFDLYLIEANYSEEEIKERIRKKEAEGGYIYEKNVIGRHLSKEQCNDWLYKNMSPKSTYIYMHEHTDVKR